MTTMLTTFVPVTVVAAVMMFAPLPVFVTAITLSPVTTLAPFLVAFPILFPLPVRNPTLSTVDFAIIPGHFDYRARHITTLDYPPRPVIGLRPVPAVTPGAPPIAVVEKYIEFNTRHEINLTAGDQYHFRGRRHHNRRRADVDIYPHIHPCIGV
jgi:hypothetical protein